MMFLVCGSLALPSKESPVVPPPVGAHAQNAAHQHNTTGQPPPPPHPHASQGDKKINLRLVDLSQIRP